MERRAGFREREGLASPPSQLKLREVSPELRALLWNAVYSDLQLCTIHDRYSGHNRIYEPWATILRDRHVRHDHKMADEFSTLAQPIYDSLKKAISTWTYSHLLDFIEWFLRHPSMTYDFRDKIETAFVEARAAYRVVDADTIVPTATDAAAEATINAIADAGDVGAAGTVTHLKQAASDLRQGNWADSIRNSIHAVEGLCILVSPQSHTLSEALKVLKRTGHIHGSLEAAFLKLYGFTNDERGVRHAQVLDSVQVDEVDAVFMFTACSAFVSYMTARSREAGLSVPT